MEDAAVQGGMPWQDFVVSTVPTVLFALAAVLLARRRRLDTVTPAATGSPEARAI